MGNRNEESGREQSAYGRSENPRERQQAQGQNEGWRQSQGGQQRTQEQQGEHWQQRGGQGGQTYGTHGGNDDENQGRGRGRQGQGSREFGSSQGFGGQDQGNQFGGQQGQNSQYDQPGSASYRPESFGYVGHLGARGQGGQGGQGGQSQGRQSQGFGYDESDRGRSVGDGGRQRFGPQGAQENWSGRSYRGLGPKNYSRSDERITEDVNERLTDDDDVDASNIEVKAEHGVVKLEGTVDKRWMKHRAEDIAESCRGVKEVENRIRVESGSNRSESSERTGQGRGQSGQAGLGSGASGQTPH